jgi:hypothetical protein
MSSIFAIGWEPEIRGILTVLIIVVVLMGSTYLILATNLGARLGFLVAFAGLFGWMATMGGIWWAYGIGLRGRDATWNEAEPIAIVLDAGKLDQAGALDEPLVVEDGASYPEIAAAAAAALVDEGWAEVPESDPGYGQATASADAILVEADVEGYGSGEQVPVAVYERGGERYPKIGDSFDFFAFRHTPHYAIVEFAPLVPTRTEPGRAPAPAEIDESRPHIYVMMIRDLGTRRQPAAFITIGSSMIFGLSLLLLSRRERVALAHRPGTDVATTGA